MKRFLPFAALVLSLAAGQAGAQAFRVDVPINIEPATSTGKLSPLAFAAITPVRSTGERVAEEP
jgi:hypothetical protein